MFAIPHECMKILLISADELEIDFCNWHEYLLSTMLFIMSIDFPFCPIFFYQATTFIDQILNWKMTSYISTMSSNHFWRSIFVSSFSMLALFQHECFILQAFLDFRSFDFHNFQFTAVYNSILLSSSLVQVNNLKNYKSWNSKPDDCFELLSDWLLSYWESQSEGSSKQLLIKAGL